jgi:alginate O-acetyltransferase complex protein AlgI
MQFNSLIFLFLFLPAAIVLALVSGKKLRNITLLVLSLLFYAWAGVSASVILIISIVLNYFFGIIIYNNVEKKKARKIFLFAIVVNVLLLAYFKYFTFILTNIYDVQILIHSKALIIKKVVPPLGISFFTFCGIAYLIDIYRGTVKAEKNFINFALFLSFFPRIIAGPIVRYKDTIGQITGRKITLENFSYGIERFIIGLGKKVLIADSFALIADNVFSLPAGQLTFFSAWMGIISYSLQIYIDFSGYSDMAIGLGKMLGFTIPENFNFPYIARSVQEFWQRWHITLSNWLRDYIFAPLAIRFRNKGKPGIALSAIITFTICGLWHNAGWNFVVWGLFHGVFLSLESLGFGNFLKRLWRPLQHFYLLVVIIFGWVFFRSADLAYAWHYCGAMLSFSNIPASLAELQIIFSTSFILNIILAIIGAAGLFALTGKYTIKLINNFNPVLKGVTIISYTIVEMAVLFLILTIASSYIAVNNYNPFIYFRF